MTSVLPQNQSVTIRPVQYRDIEDIERLYDRSNEFESQIAVSHSTARSQLRQLRRWFGILKFLSWFPNPLQYRLCIYVAEQCRRVQGSIQVAPFNRTRSTWKIKQIAVNAQELGSQLLRHCFETIGEARTWILEVNINDKDTLALYRQNGFQTLAQLTYWQIETNLLQELAAREPDLPNLLPVSNADAQLLYQLDTASMPPIVRQVFDRDIQDFKTSLFSALIDAIKQWRTHTEVVNGYVFEPQRKAAIGYFQVQIYRKGNQPHLATLTVHPAYTWLYPELLSQIARIVQDAPPQILQLASADYQPEREEYLEQIGAARIEHTLMMSRSVWHKLRESKFVSLEGIQWSEVLQGLQPARKPVPGGMSWLAHKVVATESAPTNINNLHLVGGQQNSVSEHLHHANKSLEAMPEPKLSELPQENSSG